jgi:hypothetical protein
MVRSEEALETLLAASTPAEPGGTTTLQQLPMMLFATHLLRVGYRLRTREALALAHAMQLSGNEGLMDSLFAHLLHSDRVEPSASLARVFLARGSYELAFDCFVYVPSQNTLLLATVLLAILAILTPASVLRLGNRFKGC